MGVLGGTLRERDGQELIEKYKIDIGSLGEGDWGFNKGQACGRAVCELELGIAADNRFNLCKRELAVDDNCNQIT